MQQLIAGAKCETAVPPQQPRHKSWPLWGTAAAVLVAVAVSLNGYFIDRVQGDRDLQRYITRIGEQKSVELADGSVVTLNTGTELLVSMEERARTAILRRGEGLFRYSRRSGTYFYCGFGEAIGQCAGH